MGSDIISPISSFQLKKHILMNGNLDKIIKSSVHDYEVNHRVMEKVLQEMKEIVNSDAILYTKKHKYHQKQEIN